MSVEVVCSAPELPGTERKRFSAELHLTGAIYFLISIIARRIRGTNCIVYPRVYPRRKEYKM